VEVSGGFPTLFSVVVGRMKLAQPTGYFARRQGLNRVPRESDPIYVVKPKPISPSNVKTITHAKFSATR
jgi:hypothetical protein